MNRVRTNPALTMVSHTELRALFWDLGDIRDLLEDPVLGSASHLAIWASPWMELVQRKSSMEFIIEGEF